MSYSLSLNRSNSILTLSQSKRLFALLDNPIVISSIKSSSCLTVIPYLFLIRLKQQARINGLDLNEIRLTGGAASFVLDPNGDLAYRDLDFFISIDNITSESTWTKIKQTVFTSLTSIEEKSSEFYTEKIIRIINDQDRWALISLRNHDGRNLELKFVEQMKRQYQFSVDSFQIILDPLFLQSSSRLPQLIVQSTYGNFHEALDHLHHRLIAVKAPEELRGGGLLKYCDLIARGFHPSDQFQMKDLQRYMCSRFFIDFRDCSTQEQILFKYVTSHFRDDYHIRWRFLQCLYEVIINDTMGFCAFERLSFLRIISMMCSTMIPMKTTSKYSTNERTGIDRSILVKTLIPSVPTSTTLMKKSSSSSLPAIEQIDLFVEIVHSLRTELFPKLNQLLSSM